MAYCKCLIIVAVLIYNVDTQKTYTFKEFPYKESSKNVLQYIPNLTKKVDYLLPQEVMFREVEAACERGCLGKTGVSKILCVRQCVSPSCYRDLYQADLVT